jgi:SAM-dependent methyltransferase
MIPAMTTQPGYDELADAYDEAFPDGYASTLERHVVALFAAEVVAGPAGTVVDVGCGTGHVTGDLAAAGLDVVGVDPSAGMLAIARRSHPDVRFVEGDARLAAILDDGPLAGVLARFSLIHVPPDDVRAVVDAWVPRLQSGATVVVAFQCADDSGDLVVEFDHRVARAWRWHPDAMAGLLTEAGLTERWRVVARPDAVRRFAECHLAVELA